MILAIISVTVVFVIMNTLLFPKTKGILRPIKVPARKR